MLLLTSRYVLSLTIKLEVAIRRALALHKSNVLLVFDLTLRTDSSLALQASLNKTSAEFCLAV